MDEQLSALTGDTEVYGDSLLEGENRYTKRLESVGSMQSTYDSRCSPLARIRTKKGDRKMEAAENRNPQVSRSMEMGVVRHSAKDGFVAYEDSVEQGTSRRHVSAESQYRRTGPQTLESDDNAVDLRPKRQSRPRPRSRSRSRSHTRSRSRSRPRETKKKTKKKQRSTASMVQDFFTEVSSEGCCISQRDIEDMFTCYEQAVSALIPENTDLGSQTSSRRRSAKHRSISKLRTRRNRASTE